MAIAELERKLQAQTPPPVHTTATPPQNLWYKVFGLGCYHPFSEGLL